MGYEEFRRWYWLKTELMAFARQMGLRTDGAKEVLAGRIASALDGVAFTEPPRRTTGGQQLSGPLTSSTIIPPGQRCSQVVRAWFSQELGAPYRFDAAMRTFFADADGTRTLGDALAHHHATRDASPGPIGSQFEYNHFTQAWHQANPDGTRSQLLDAWRQYRETPLSP